MEVAADVYDPEKARNMVEELGETVREFFVKMAEAGIIGEASMQFAAWSIVAGEEVEPSADEVELEELPVGLLAAAQQLLDAQKLTVETEMFRLNAEMRGMYNGMELIMSTLQERPPLFLDEFGEFSLTLN